MVDYGIFHPVVNHYRWFVETLAHIASIYHFLRIFSFLLTVYHIFPKMSSVLFCVMHPISGNDVFAKQMTEAERAHSIVVSKVGGFGRL